MKKYRLALLSLLYVLLLATNTCFAGTSTILYRLSYGDCEPSKQDTLPVSKPLVALPEDSLASLVQDTALVKVASWQDSLQRMQVALGELLNDPLLERSQLGLCVYDLTADRLVFQHGMKQRLRPASTMKAITAIAALDILGTKFEFLTKWTIDAPITRDTCSANIYLRGVMDPLLGKEDLKRIATLLADSGVTVWTGNLVLDATHKDTLSRGLGWCWDDESSSLSPFLCDGEDMLVPSLSQVLSERGIQWRGSTQQGRSPQHASTLYTHRHTIDQILLPMLKKSNNQFAEALFYSIAANSGKTFAGRKEAAAQVEKFISQRLHLPSYLYEIADGSGLSLYNYVSAEMQVAFLKYAYSNENIYRHFQPALPVMGVDGTLKKRCRGTSAQGKVFAKTGTVSGISSLMGYAVAADGRLLCFSIINQGVVSSKEGRTFQDKVCRTLTQKYE